MIEPTKEDWTKFHKELAKIQDQQARLAITSRFRCFLRWFSLAKLRLVIVYGLLAFSVVCLVIGWAGLFFLSGIGAALMALHNYQHHGKWYD